MILKTKMSIAKEFAKKHYAGAMDSMKELASKSAIKTKTLGSKVKKQSKKFYKKNPIFDKSDVAFIKQNPGFSAGAAGVGLVAGAGIGGIASGTYNLMTGQRNVRVKRKTAKEIKQMKKTYNI
jgi:ElaB/YqjD/DUF883 family membrane-anchored ribosome-binding protein